MFNDFGKRGGMADTIARRGHVQMADLLTPEAAKTLLNAVMAAPFRLSVNSGSKAMDLDLDGLQTLSAEQSNQMTQLIHAGAKQGFQYCFDTYRLSDEVEGGWAHRRP
jgi:SM-20-related protein